MVDIKVNNASLEVNIVDLFNTFLQNKRILKKLLKIFQTKISFVTYLKN